jgi:hypothetical protein
MRFKDISESSPLTFQGSITPDLLISKIWLADTLKSLGYEKFSTIYILGSWYGNMAYVLNKQNIKFDKIINVDSNKKWLKFSHQLLTKLGINVKSILTDANNISYQDLDRNSLIINASVQEIKRIDWFKKIPSGTIVAIEYRSDGPEIKDLNFSETLYVGEKHLTDPETSYTRYLKIGLK